VWRPCGFGAAPPTPPHPTRDPRCCSTAPTGSVRSSPPSLACGAMSSGGSRVAGGGSLRWKSPLSERRLLRRAGRPGHSAPMRMSSDAGHPHLLDPGPRRHRGSRVTPSASARCRRQNFDPLQKLGSHPGTLPVDCTRSRRFRLVKSCGQHRSAHYRGVEECTKKGGPTDFDRTPFLEGMNLS
jgi:hypothetical protein